MFDLIENNTADMVALSMRITPKRSERVDFSFPINYYYHGYLTSGLGGLEDFRFMLKPFATSVWITLIFALILVALCIYWLEKRKTFFTALWYKLCVGFWGSLKSGHLAGPPCLFLKNWKFLGSRSPRCYSKTTRHCESGGGCRWPGACRQCG